MGAAMARRKQALKKSFVQTAAATAAGLLSLSMATGCDDFGSTTNNPPDPCEIESCNPPFIDDDPILDEECPEEEPFGGSSCTVPRDESCFYNYSDDSCDGGSFDTTYICDDGAWFVADQSHVDFSCEDEFVCPDELPEAGSPCDSDGFSESFCELAVDTPCDVQVATATCELDGTWSVVDPVCTLTPQQCFFVDSPEMCIFATGCTWVEPGCGEPTLPAAACVPDADCAENGCAYGTCQQVSVDTCVDAECDACGEMVNVCVLDS